MDSMFYEFKNPNDEQTTEYLKENNFITQLVILYRFTSILLVNLYKILIF